MADITPETVKHLASLARISLNAEEIETLTSDLSKIVESVEDISEVATADVPIMSHPIVGLNNPLRPDVVGEPLDRDLALSQAPDHDGSRFKVSAILGEEQ